MKTSILEQLAALEAENAAQARQIATLTQERDALQQDVIDLGLALLMYEEEPNG